MRAILQEETTELLKSYEKQIHDWKYTLVAVHSIDHHGQYYEKRRQIRDCNRRKDTL